MPLDLDTIRASEVNASDVYSHYRTCNLCEAMCGLEIKVKGQDIVSIQGDEANVFSRGHICPKAVALRDIYSDPDRLKFPMRRTDNGWAQIGWDEAFDEVATKLRAVHEARGANAVAVYQGNPVIHNLGSQLYAAPFIRALKTRNRFSATSVDQLPHQFVAYHMLGRQLLLPIPDIYLYETTRHANIILPPTTGLETEHYDISFHSLAVRNTAKYSPALFAPAAGARHDWEILLELRRRLGGRPADPRNRKDPRVKLDVFSRMPPDKIVDLALRFGPYGFWGGNEGGRALSLRKLKQAPHAIDFGPLRPCLPDRLMTRSRRIELAPEILLRDVARMERKLLGATASDGNYDLSLVGRRHLRSNNSWMHNSPRLVRGPERCTLLMHPQDAATRGLSPDQMVCVRSRVGEIELPLQISDQMMSGVVSIPHGWGHNRPGIRLATAQQHKGASINDLSDEQVLDELTGNAAFSGVPVSIQAL